jgi:glycosyltransferase involved in cell wall biosynthesis
MRVLILSLVYPPPSTGGAVVVYEIAQALSNLNNEVAVIIPAIEWKELMECEDLKLDEKAKVLKVNVPFADKPKVAARACYQNMLKKSLEFTKEFKPDFILTFFHPFHRVTHAAVACAKKLSIPSLIKVEDITFEQPKGFVKKIQRGIEKGSNAKALNAADHIFVVNDYVAKQANELYRVPNDKISILPNGVNIDRFKPARTGKTKTIVFTGVMYYHRGLDFLIEHAPKIIERNEDTKFRLIGAGPELDKLQKLVNARKLDQYFEFTGWVGWNKIPEMLSDASIGIGPLKHTKVTYQAMPIKVLEYMASGLPIIALEDTLPRNVLKHEVNGYFVKDGENFADKVTKLLSNKELSSTMGAMSREIAEHEFDWRIIVGKIIEGYQKLV